MSQELIKADRPEAPPQLGPEARLALDLALGLANLTAGVAVVAVRGVNRVTSPLTRLLWRPPLLPEHLHPATFVADLAHTGGVERDELQRRVEALLDVWAPAIVAAIVQRLDLTLLVEDHVDLDRIVSTVDLDAAVARVDLDAAVARVDLDAAVAKVDLDGVVALVDVGAVVQRVDLDAVAATIDVDAVVARADLEAVISRIDIIGIVEEVLDVIDLPAIIRDSTGSMASETVRGARMTGISADDALSRAVDRALFRRRRAPESGTPT